MWLLHIQPLRSPAQSELGMTNPLNTWSEANWMSDALQRMDKSAETSLELLARARARVLEKELPFLELVQKHLDEGTTIPAAASWHSENSAGMACASLNAIPFWRSV